MCRHILEIFSSFINLALNPVTSNLKCVNVNLPCKVAGCSCACKNGNREAALFILARLGYRVGARPFHHLGVVAGGSERGGVMRMMGEGRDGEGLHQCNYTKVFSFARVCVCVCEGHSLGPALVQEMYKGRG